jgi:hypothetical protein
MAEVRVVEAMMRERDAPNPIGDYATLRRLSRRFAPPRQPFAFMQLPIRMRLPPAVDAVPTRKPIGTPR